MGAGNGHHLPPGGQRPHSRPRGIGTEAARLCAAFGMTVTGVNPGEEPSSVRHGRASPGRPGRPPAQGRFPDPLITPETPETVRMIDARRLSLIKDGAFLVNVGRGKSWSGGRPRRGAQGQEDSGAALDVFEQEPLPPDSPLLVHAERADHPPHGGRRRILSRPGSPDQDPLRTARGSQSAGLINVVDKSKRF